MTLCRKDIQTLQKNNANNQQLDDANDDYDNSGDDKNDALHCWNVLGFYISQDNSIINNLGECLSFNPSQFRKYLTLSFLCSGYNIAMHGESFAPTPQKDFHVVLYGLSLEDIILRFHIDLSSHSHNFHKNDICFVELSNPNKSI